jgi:hypothetical protein
MKLKDIAAYCLHYTSYLCEGNLAQKQRYYWCINGGTYAISEAETYGDYSSNTGLTNIIHLTEYNHWNMKDNNTIDRISLNLDNEVTIFDKFIIVHKTNNNTDVDDGLFRTNDYYSNNQNFYTSDYYLLGMVHPVTGLQMVDLRSIFKDLIDPPVQPKPAELTLDEKIDGLIDELMKDNKVKAIKKLRRMLNERL